MEASLSQADLQLAQSVTAALGKLEVEAVAGADVSFRSALRKTLGVALTLAQEAVDPVRDNAAASHRAMVMCAFKFLACFHGLLPQRYSSLVGHVAARDFWDEALQGATHATADELRKALAAHLPKEVASAWTSKLHFDVQHLAGDREFSALTDSLGLVGGVARAVNRVPYVVSAPGALEARTLQMASTWPDDLRPGKPLRAALETVGVLNKFAESDNVGTMLIEFEEELAVARVLRKDRQPKALVGHAATRAQESVGAAYARSLTNPGQREEGHRKKSVVDAMVRETTAQAEALVDVQVRAREMMAQVTDAAWRQRLQLLLELVRRLIAEQSARVNALREWRDALKGAGDGGAPQQKGIQRLLQPIRRATSKVSLSTGAGASVAQRRSSANSASLPDAQLAASTTPTSSGPSSPRASALPPQVQEVSPGRQRSSTLGSASTRPPSLARVQSSSRPATPPNERESSEDVSSASEAAAASAATGAATPDEPSSNTRASKRQSVRLKKVPRRRKDGARRSESGGADDDDPESGSEATAPPPPTSVEAAFGVIFAQLEEAKRTLQEQEEKLRVDQGRLRAKKRTLARQQRTAQAQLEAQRAQLDERERALEKREAAHEKRLRKLTRLQKEEHMRSLISAFSEEQVVPLQRALRVWMCRRALRIAVRMALTAEPFREQRRRNAALAEIRTSEMEHVARMELIVRYRTQWAETFSVGGGVGGVGGGGGGAGATGGSNVSSSNNLTALAGSGGPLPSGVMAAGSGVLPLIRSSTTVAPALHARVFQGLDDALEASKLLLIELNVRKLDWPSNTRVGDLLQSWSVSHMARYKTFVNNYDLACAALSEARTKKSFVEWEQRMGAQGLPPLDSLLIGPVQRLPRYRLLLEALVGLTPEDHCDHAALLGALEAVRVAVDEVNQGKAVAEQMQSLLALDEVIVGQDPQWPVVVAGRTLIHRGMLGDAMDPRAAPKHYFLFSDALFETQPRRKKFLFGKGPAQEEFEYVRALPLLVAALEMQEIPPSVCANGFSLINGAAVGGWKEVSLFALDARELRSWVVAIKTNRRGKTARQQCTNCSTTLVSGADRCHVCGTSASSASGSADPSSASESSDQLPQAEAPVRALPPLADPAVAVPSPRRAAAAYMPPPPSARSLPPPK